MKKIKLFFIVCVTAILSSCTVAELEAFNNIINESTGQANISIKDEVITLRGYNRQIDYDLKIKINSDEFGYVKEVFVNGILENSKNTPIKVTIDIPVRNNFGDLVHTFRFEKIIEANRNVRLNENDRIPKFERGKIKSNEIKMSAVILPRYKYDSYYTGSDIRVSVTNDSLGYTTIVNFNGILENTSSYPVKAVVTLPARDDYGKIVHQVTLEKVLNAYSRERISTISKIPHYIYARVNPRELKVEYVRVVNDSDGVYNSLYPGEIRRNIDFVINRDGLGYVKYIDVNGRIRNDRNHPIKLLITVPLKNDFGRTIEKLKYTKYINEYQTVNISDTIRVPYGITGEADQRDIEVEVFRASSY